MWNEKLVDPEGIDEPSSDTDLDPFDSIVNESAQLPVCFIESGDIRKRGARHKCVISRTDSAGVPIP
ncbi:hypothetical protein CEPID_06320 [Corynebacterium epidermidicanis]|uniref:Uncharacterized protein n=1 Tax=Corynebacterium epidermidicanis TaxID=1050174 RepID=A0A0G3GPS2_9CORY|nr:hypothetical protein CEPID_06320 [Corynebacterium epidermidicanis]